MATSFARKVRVRKDFTPKFLFNPIYTSCGLHIHVSVLNQDGETCHFTMVEKEGKWKIVEAPLPPQWILDLEMVLEQIIYHRMAI